MDKHNSYVSFKRNT